MGDIQVAELQDRVAKLEAEVLFNETASEQQRDLSDALALTHLGMATLAYIASSPEGVDVDRLVEAIEEPEGWLAVGRLLRAGLIDENGRIVYPTLRGYEAAIEIEAFASSEE